MGHVISRCSGREGRLLTLAGGCIFVILAVFRPRPKAVEAVLTQDKVEDLDDEVMAAKVSAQNLDLSLFCKSPGSQDELGSASPYCLEIRASSLGAEAGLGLFTTQAIPAESVICIYSGKTYRTRDALKLQDKSYLMRVGPQLYVDAHDCMHVLARYINDCRNPAIYNVVFDKQLDAGYALVVSTRNIRAGEELFVDYGKWYWASSTPRRILPSHAARILRQIQT
eukprot:TRINITY_DN59830_c0_g1_i1.p1 TRINITY_DN59830_c0_g1~~TRINITY_DN59830_c0_g1_i1.p1  ORF type:complete len:225 (-),score=18.18 TRINITY_DN59830_c0_g1_i1:343-1017(-)